MSAANRTLMVMAGGTGGHVYPALAVADALRARGWDVFWLGTRNGLEARVVPAAGIDMVWVSMGGVRGKGLLKKLLLPLMLLVAFWQSLRAILQRRPDVVLGMGGYTAFPGGMMASLLEQAAGHPRTELGRRPHQPRAGLSGRPRAGCVPAGVQRRQGQAHTVPPRGDRMGGQPGACGHRRRSRRQVVPTAAVRCACWWSAAASARRP